MDKMVYKIIEKRSCEKKNYNDVLSILLNSCDQLQADDKRQLRDEVLTLLFAGHETSSNGLSWTLYLISQHPDVEQKLQNEISKVLAGQTPNATHLSQLAYTKMVIQESMRIYPPVWMFGRQALKSDSIAGHSIGANSRMSISPYTMHRHPEFWDNPETFDPERFEPELLKKKPRYAYLPFAGGERVCIGNRFAMMEMQLIIAMIMQRYRFKLVPGQTIEPQALITLKPKYGLWMNIESKE